MKIAQYETNETIYIPSRFLKMQDIELSITKCMKINPRKLKLFYF